MIKPSVLIKGDLICNSISWDYNDLRIFSNFEEDSLDLLDLTNCVIIEGDIINNNLNINCCGELVVTGNVTFSSSDYLDMKRNKNLLPVQCLIHGNLKCNEMSGKINSNVTENINCLCLNNSIIFNGDVTGDFKIISNGMTIITGNANCE